MLAEVQGEAYYIKTKIHKRKNEVFKMKIVVRNAGIIKTKTNPSNGEITRGRRVLCDYCNDAIAEWKYINDECGIKLEDIKPGMEINMLCDANGWVTVFEKIGA